MFGPHAGMGPNADGEDQHLAKTAFSTRWRGVVSPVNAKKLTMIISWLRFRLHKIYCIDARSLALFRIALGIVVLMDLVQRSRHALTHYSDAGVYSRTDAFASLDPFRWSILFANGTARFADMVFWVGIIATIAMILGWKTRLATILVWVIVFSVQMRNSHLNSGADTMIRISLFWSMLLPLGSVWSLDHFFARPSSESGEKTGRSTSIASIATLGLLLQVASVYLFTAILKDGPRWREDGSALYFALGARDVTSDFGDWIFRTAPEPLLTTFTFGSLMVEFAVPLMLLLPMRSGWLRTFGVFLVVLLHLGILTTMTVGLFPLVSIASAVALLPPWFWDTLVARVRLPDWVSRVKLKAAGIGFAERTSDPVLAPPVDAAAFSVSGGSQNLHFVHSPRPNRIPFASIACNLLAAMAIVVMLMWNIQTVSSYQVTPEIRRIALSTGLYQNWSMFAPGPQTATVWFVVEGELVSGEKIDLLLPLDSGNIGLRQPVVWDQSGEIELKDKYWRKYFHAINGRDNDSRKFAAYACRTWNTSNQGDDRLQSVRLFRGLAVTQDDGERGDPKFSQMGSWTCT